MTREEAKREILFAKREVMADSWIDKAYDVAIKALEEPKPQGLIRCKDCTRFDKKRGCNLVEGLNIAKADSFCSYAERKEQNDYDT